MRFSPPSSTWNIPLGPYRSLRNHPPRRLQNKKFSTERTFYTCCTRLLSPPLNSFPLKALSCPIHTLPGSFPQLGQVLHSAILCKHEAPPFTLMSHG